MRTVVVQAHPLLDSYNAALLERVMAGLETSGLDPTSFRLGEGERPTAGEIRGTAQLVLVYPTWQAGLPAMLLDWLHEMLSSEVEPFGEVRRLRAVTTGGSTRHRNRVIGEWGRRYLRTHVASRCAPGTSLEWLPFYKIDRKPRAAIDAFLEQVERSFAGD